MHVQEREEAARLFGGADAAAPAANGERTFEPGEGMAEAEAPANAPEPAPEVVEQPSVRKGPTPEQLTAIKARINPDPHPHRKTVLVRLRQRPRFWPEVPACHDALPDSA